MRTPIEDAEVTRLLSEHDHVVARLLALGITGQHLRQRVQNAMEDTGQRLADLLADAPKDDPDVAGLLRDCARLEQLASEMVEAIPASDLGLTVQSVGFLGVRSDTTEGSGG